MSKLKSVPREPNVSYNVTFAVGSGGSTGTINPSGTKSYNQGARVTVTATPSTGYSFNYFYISDGRTVTSNPYTFNVYGKQTIYAYFKVRSYTVSASVSPSGAGYIDGAGTYNYGSTCTLRAHDDYPYVFSHWSSGETSKSISFTVTGNTSRTAYYYIPQYTVSLSAYPTEGGSVSGGGTYNQGTSVTIRATASSTYKFDGWYYGQSLVSTNANYSFTVTGNISYQARFSLNRYNVSVVASPSDGGSVSGGGTSIPPGTRIGVLATPNTEAHYHFNYWQRSDGETYNQPSWEFTVNANYTCTAYFSLDTYQLYLGVDPSGAGTVSGAGEYTWGAVAHITATANTGYRFIRWSDDNTNTDRYINIYSTTTLVAYFELIPQHVTFTSNPVNALWFSTNDISEVVTEFDLYVTPGYNYEDIYAHNSALGYVFKNWDNSPVLTDRKKSVEWTGSYDKSYVGYAEYIGYIYLTLKQNEHGNAWVDHIQPLGEYFTFPFELVPNHKELTNETYVTFRASPNLGYVFDHWERAGVSVSTSSEYTVLVYGADQAEIIYKPVFREATPTYKHIQITSNLPYETGAYYAFIRVILPSGNQYSSSIDSEFNGNFLVGSKVTISRPLQVTIDDLEYPFQEWSDGEVDRPIGDDVYARTTFTLIEDFSVEAIYVRDPITIYAVGRPEEGGSFLLSTETIPQKQGKHIIVQKGSNVYITAVPNQGYDFVKWSDTQSTEETRIIRNVQSSDIFYAEFRENGQPKEYFHVEVIASPEEGGTALGTDDYQVGNPCTVFAIPKDGWKFIGWSNGIKEWSFEFTVTQDVTLYAFFKPIKPLKIQTIFKLLFKRKNKQLIKIKY